MGKLIRNSNSQHSTPPINNSNPTMKSVIVLLVLVAVSQIDAFPRAIFYPGFRPGGNGAGFGTGNAGPFGASATGVGISNAYNGGFSSGSGNGFGSTSPFGYNAGGNGNSFSFGR